MKKLLILTPVLCTCLSTYAQKANDVEMADTMRSSGKIYVVIATISIIFIGLALFLFAIDRRLKKLEKN